MTTTKFYPAIERKNDYVIKNVILSQGQEARNLTKRKSCFEGKILIGVNVTTENNRTEITNVFK